MGVKIGGKPPSYFRLLMRNTCRKTGVTARIEQGIDGAPVEMRRNTAIGCQAIGKQITL